MNEPNDTPSLTDSVVGTGSTVTAHVLEATQINKYHVRNGHGFSAEDANTLHDRWNGRHVEQVGKGNGLNGADRLVDGTAIQSKYCATALSSVEEAFGKDGLYRYTGQVLEVPKDQHEACVALMREKISAGKVPGITDPNAAEQLVRKGEVTYRQAVNIAKAGTIDGLVFDVRTHAVVAGSVGALSFVVMFAQAKWQGRATKEALVESLLAGGGAGTATLVTGVATSQLLRTKAGAAMRVGSRKVVKVVYDTKLGKKAITKLAGASLGKAVGGGAAINHVAKIARSNTVTAAISTVVMTTPDMYRAAIDKSISWGQLAKNLGVRVAGVAGGVGGWMAGAVGGAALGSVVPVVGTAAGGFVGGVMGSLTGGGLASYGTKKLADKIHPDDAVGLVDELREPLARLAYDYLLTEEELEAFGEMVQQSSTPAFWRQLYAATERTHVITQTFEPVCEQLVATRPTVAWQSVEISSIPPR